MQSFQVSIWQRLERFLVLGADKGTYYVTEQKLKKDNALCVLECLKSDGIKTVDIIVEISDRAPKNSPAIFALALAFSFGDNVTKNHVKKHFAKVCRIPTHLYEFVEYVTGFRGWGRSLKNLIAGYYNSQDLDILAYHAIKYQSRDGWSHRDLLRLSHPKTNDETRNSIYHWMVNGWESVGHDPHPNPVLRTIWAFEYLKIIKTPEHISKYKLPRECIPSELLKRPDIWEALLYGMPATALLRNLGTLSKVGLLVGDAERYVVSRLSDTDALKKARVHPIAILSALKVYGQGHGEFSKATWDVSQKVVNALDNAFYKAFQNVEPTGKRILLAVDISGSMGSPVLSGGLTPRTAAAAMALVIANVEPKRTIMGFSHKFIPLEISPDQRLDSVISYMGKLPYGDTDCALPMLWAAGTINEYDAFITLTDSETWCGKPTEALQQYRKESGINAKSIVVAMTATEATVADPNDPGQLDVVGFDTTVPDVISNFIGCGVEPN